VPGAIHRFLADDHVRLAGLLDRAVADPAVIDGPAFAAFRAGLLRHIAMEEKVLLPDARSRRGGEALPVAAQLRDDHAALASLLVPTPTHRIAAAIRDILEDHNPLEEGPDGLYEACEELAGPEIDGLLERLQAVPAVRVAAYNDSPRTHEHVAAVLERRARPR
jgi:hypothetical protein